MINKVEFGGSPERMCGNCTACCLTHEVREIGKKSGEWCLECKIGKGCKIYANRPDGCNDFSCQWKQGVFHINERPDKAGIVVDYLEAVTDGRSMPVGLLLESVENGFQRRFTQKAIDFLKNIQTIHRS